MAANGSLTIRLIERPTEPSPLRRHAFRLLAGHQIHGSWGTICWLPSEAGMLKPGCWIGAIQPGSGRDPNERHRRGDPLGRLPFRAPDHSDGGRGRGRFAFAAGMGLRAQVGRVQRVCWGTAPAAPRQPQRQAASSLLPGAAGRPSTSSRRAPSPMGKSSWSPPAGWTSTPCRTASTRRRAESDFCRGRTPAQLALLRSAGLGGRGSPRAAFLGT